MSSFASEEFAREEFFGGAKFVTMKDRPKIPRMSISTALRKRSLTNAIIWQGSLEVNSEHSCSFYLGRDFANGPFPSFRGNGHKLRIFCFRKPENLNQAWPECHTINYLLT